MTQPVRELPKQTGVINALIDMVWQHCEVIEKKTVYHICHNFLSANERAVGVLTRIFNGKEKGWGGIISKAVLKRYFKESNIKT